MDIHFNCTQCGGCCRDAKVPLTVSEAVQWLNRGHKVQLLCEASPWPAALDDDPKASHFKRRSFAAMCGSMPTRVVAMLVADVVGACPNLQADNRCAIYEDRPLICRIYPAEVNPFVLFKPENKRCPPEAWSGSKSVPPRGGVLVSEATLEAIRASRHADASEADVKGRLCLALNIASAALVHEAALLYSPAGADLQSALAVAMSTDSPTTPLPQWRFVSDRAQTRESITRRGGVALPVGDSDDVPFQHHEFAREPIFNFQ